MVNREGKVSMGKGASNRKGEVSLEKGAVKGEGEVYLEKGEGNGEGEVSIGKRAWERQGEATPECRFAVVTLMKSLPGKVTRTPGPTKRRTDMKGCREVGLPSQGRCGTVLKVLRDQVCEVGCINLNKNYICFLDEAFWATQVTYTITFYIR